METKVVVFLFAVVGLTSAAQLAGGWEDVDPNDKMLQEILTPVEQQLNARSNAMLYERILKVTNVRRQVVAGYNYEFSYVLGRTNCRKSKPGLDAKKCDVNDQRVCSMRVWTKPWEDNFIEISADKCEEFHEKKQHQNCQEIDHGRDSFEAFKSKHQRMYESPLEDEKRFAIFQDNMQTAQKIQADEQGTACYGATQFADLSKEEFKRHLGLRPDLGDGNDLKSAAIPKADPPAAYDWRDHGAVTPVKNQGSCGSCWAFSTTGNIEGQWQIKKKSLVSLSEQELVDCDKVDQGCEGGLPSQAYKQIEKLGGLEGEKDYAYKGADDKCVFDRSKVKVYINSSVSISKDEGEMASWLAQNGPISIGINANVMQFYFGGISHPWKIFCNPKSLDHGVLIVGYGVEGNKPYWIIKNSWGPSWGEKGYYRAFRGDGVCGLNQMCTSAVVN